MRCVKTSLGLQYLELMTVIGLEIKFASESIPFKILVLHFIKQAMEIDIDVLIQV